MSTNKHFPYLDKADLCLIRKLLLIASLELVCDNLLTEIR